MPEAQSLFSSDARYLVVNLENGKIRISPNPPDLSRYNYISKSSELWLRRITKGTFTMGSPEDEEERGDDETQHEVTLTKDYYIGIFPVTQRQYELITGAKPSYFNNADYYATRPVEQVSYNMIRGSYAGTGWPANNDVDGDSFLGKLRSKTGFDFDLPTEAQWEYACRAGTTTALCRRRYWDDSNDPPSYCNTSQGTEEVGSYPPNDWGLYDMHGNVWEWCLDWYASYSRRAATDPAGAKSASRGRVLRGGCWKNHSDEYRSALRDFSTPDSQFNEVGFRVVLPYSISRLDVNGEKKYKTQGAFVTVTVPDKKGHTFVNWAINGISVADKKKKTISFTMPANDVVLTPNYTVNKYTQTVDGKTKRVAFGTTVTVTVPDKKEHTFVNWAVNGISVADDKEKTISFTMPANDVVLTPNYTVNKYTLTVNGVTERVAFGTAVTGTVSEKYRCYFKDWTVSGVSIADRTALPISFTMPANDVVLTPNYRRLAMFGTDYVCIDLLTGHFWDSPTAPDLSDDTCRTTELWLRRIPKGTFTMGSPEDEKKGRGNEETQHQVTLTKDYYIGIFPMTQKQYELITGAKPSYFNNDNYYATRPVERVSYNMIRGSVAGAGWPSNNDVDSNSFLGKLRSKTKLAFDLPTEGAVGTRLPCRNHHGTQHREEPDRRIPGSRHE